MNLNLPETIKIQLTEKSGSNLPVKNVLIQIVTRASHKNNIELSPFISNEQGSIQISKADLQKNAESMFASGLMDYGYWKMLFLKLELLRSAKEIL